MRFRMMLCKNLYRAFRGQWVTTGAGAALVASACAQPPAIAEPINYTDLLGRPRPAATERVQYGATPSQFAELWMPSGKLAPFGGGLGARRLLAAPRCGKSALMTLVILN
jgi:hypothetical protein